MLGHLVISLYIRNGDYRSQNHLIRAAARKAFDVSEKICL